MNRAPRHYDATPTVEPPPDWWAAEFHRRQAKCRRRICGVIAKHGGESAASVVRAAVCEFSPLEYGHALEAIVRDVMVIEERRIERYRVGCLGATMAKEFVFLRLTAKGVKHADAS